MGDIDKDHPNMKLMEAASNCDLEEVTELLKAGASAEFIHDPPGVWGSCSTKGPLHAAILAKPCKPVDTSDSGEAASSAEFGAECTTWKTLLQTLISAKADVNAKSAVYDWRGCGSTRTAFEMVFPSALQDLELLEMFLVAGGDANTKSVFNVHSMRTDGMSVEYVLHKAVKGRSLEIARALLDAGAQVDPVASDHFSNERGFDRHMEETPLHQACGSRGTPNLQMCALLLARGANVNASRQDLEQVDSGLSAPTDDPRESDFASSVINLPVSETALHIALCKKDADLVTMLISAGADIACKRRRGDELTSCKDLCGGNDALLKALMAEWTPESHKLFPEEVRKSVEAALMTARRQQWPLPDTVLFRVCALAAGAQPQSGPAGISSANGPRDVDAE